MPTILPRTMGALLLLALLGLAGLWGLWISGAPPLGAQSIVRAELEGTVRTDDGRPLAEATVTATELRTGVSLWAESDREGTFQIAFLREGEYEVRVEALGFLPRLYRGVRLHSGRSGRLAVALEAAPPPVDAVDTVFVGAAGRGRFDGGAGRSISRSDLSALPDRRLGIGGLVALSPLADETLGSEGLPGSMTTVVLDGLAFTPARHPLQTGGNGDLPFVPRLALASLDVHGRMDVEWAGAAGGYVAALSRPASGERSGELFGAGTADPLWHAEPFSDVGTPGMLSGWGGAAAHIPFANDSSHLFVGVEGMSVRTPRPSPFPDGLAARLVESRPPAEGIRAEDLSSPWTEDLETISGLTRFDWKVGGAAEVMARASFTAISDQGGRFFAQPPDRRFGAPFDGTDVSAAVSVLTDVHPRVSLEVRAGLERSTREWGGTRGPGEPSTLPTTRFVETGTLLGPDPGLTGRVDRTAFVGGPTAHLEWLEHQIKAGFSVSVPSYEYEHVHRTGGEYVFGSPERLARGEGVFMRAVGPLPTQSFTVPEFGLFLQHRWEPLAGIRFTSGIRFDRESLPDGRVAPNLRWAELTGLRNDEFRARIDKVSPRIGVSWDLTGGGTTVIEGGLGTHHGRLDPGALNEVLSLSGSLRHERRIGALDRWPDLPEASSGEPGVVLALFGPALEAPRTARAQLGLSQRVGDGTVLHLSGTFRRTEFLLRRSDLNLSLGPSGSHGDGRPVLGELRKVGSVVAAEPGTNRRFPEFDQVWALSADGWSEFQGVTVAFEHEAGDGLDLFGSYTLSSTEDNLIGARGGTPEGRLEPRLGTGSSGEWARGTSDFDVPHRMSAGARLRFPVLMGIEAAGIYRFRSGMPFTAGFRPGVDVSGDGSGHNDPAFVGEAGPGPLACLSPDVGGLARRNGCRGSGFHVVDLHLAAELFRIGPSVGALTIDLFNVLDTELGLPDPALLLVADEGPLERDSATGEVRLPFEPNPGFGEVLQSLRPGRMVRLGLRVTLP